MHNMQNQMLFMKYENIFHYFVLSITIIMVSILHHRQNKD